MPTRAQDSTDQQDRDWFRLPPDEVLGVLDTSRDGLDEGEARARRQRFGPNRLREQEEVSPWRILLDQFTSPLIYVLLGALVVTLAIQSYADAIVIGAVLVVNATVGFIQEYRAESAVQSLMEVVSPQATVRRDGAERQVDAEDLVPGDVVVLSQGVVVPADVRVLDVSALQVDEAPLTGESVPVAKHADPLADADEHVLPADQTNMAFMATAVTSGSGTGVVVRTGSRTEIGQIAEQVEEAGESETPLQQRIDRLARWITVAILVVAVVAVGIGVLLGRSVVDMLLLGVALAVAAIPAGLPIVVTVALAIGVSRMSRRHAVIRNLPAVDTLGSTSVIVSDKTGTLTQNRMTVRAVVAAGERADFEGEVHETAGAVVRDGEPIALEEHPALAETLRVSLLANDAEIVGEGSDDAPSGDPMEVALRFAAAKAGLSLEDELARHPRRETVPFRTEQRFMATIHEADDGPLVCVKGAPERIAAMCEDRLDADGQRVPFDAEEVTRDEQGLAGGGLRVLAMAVGRGEDLADAVSGDEPRGLTFLGLAGLLDPPRPSAIDAVDRCHDAGIRVLMVTGDHATTAAAIGHQVHLDRWRDGGAGDGAPLARRGADLVDRDDAALDRDLDAVEVYARVSPDQKLRIVDRLKARDEIVAVTGDGVNDAPALESAHIGAAMGSGTDVAKESADMVVTDDDFASVYAAVEEGRTAFRNIRMATFFLLSTGAADVLIILSALAFDWPLPLLPAQILWLNVVTNGIADVALAFEPGEQALFRRPPRPKDEGVLDRVLLERLALVGIWLAVGTVAVFAWQWGGDDDNLTVARTAALTTLVLFQKVHVFNCRSEDVSLFSKRLLANKVLLAGVLTSLTIHVGALYLPWTQRLLDVTPLDAWTWVVMAAVALTAIIVNEAHKRLRPRPEAVATGSGRSAASAR